MDIDTARQSLIGAIVQHGHAAIAHDRALAADQANGTETSKIAKNDLVAAIKVCQQRMDELIRAAAAM